MIECLSMDWAILAVKKEKNTNPGRLAKRLSYPAAKRTIAVLAAGNAKPPPSNQSADQLPLLTSH
jgi:hypothetical protein